MKKEIKVYKINGYDKFRCIADKCKFTCCAGWDINVDADTYNKWKNAEESCGYILVKVISDDEGNYYIDKNTAEGCPFLDQKKLCEIVKKNGDDYLSSTCRNFPRIHNELENIVENSLSCGCPEVLEIIDLLNKIDLSLVNNCTKDEEPIEKSIRDILIKMVDSPFANLAEKLLISFKFVKSLYDMDEITIEAVVYELEKYQHDPISFMKENIVKTNPAIEDTLNEVNKVFLEIIENYKRVPVLKDTLKSISIQALKREQKAEAGLWCEFIIKFREYDEFINKCINLKIINSCLSEDLGETLISIQLILLEYIFVRYASYLKFSMTIEITKSNIKDYVVVFSRIIENNADAVLDYIYEKYNDEILELDYLSFISGI